MEMFPYIMYWKQFSNSFNSFFLQIPKVGTYYPPLIYMLHNRAQFVVRDSLFRENNHLLHFCNPFGLFELFIEVIKGEGEYVVHIIIYINFTSQYEKTNW